MDYTGGIDLMKTDNGKWLIYFMLAIFIVAFLSAFLCKSIAKADDISKPLPDDYNADLLNQRIKYMAQIILRSERMRTVIDTFPSGQKYDTLVSPVRFDTVTNVLCSCTDTLSQNSYKYIEQINDTLIVIGKHFSSSVDTVRCTIIGIIGGF